MWYMRVVDERWRPCASGEAEAALVKALCQAGAPLAPFRVASGGAVMTSLPLRWAICSAASPGLLSDPPDVPGYARLGAGLARLHQAAEGIQRPAVRAADGVLEQPVNTLNHCWDLWPEATELPVLVDRLDRWWRCHPPDDWGIIHGDAHAGNCTVAGDIVTFFDTECAGWGPRSYDLAVVRGTLLRQLPSAAHWEPRWTAFLDGYSRVRPLSATTIAAIPACLLLRRLWLLLVASRMPWRYESERFRKLGVDASCMLASEMLVLEGM